MRCAIGGGSEVSEDRIRKLHETYKCVEYHYVSPDTSVSREVLSQLKTNGMKPIYDIEMAVWVNQGMNVNADIGYMRPALKAIKDAGWEGFSSEGISQKQVSVLQEFLPYYNYGGEAGEDVYYIDQDGNKSMYYRHRELAFANYHECYHRGVNYTPAIMSGNKSTPKHMGLTLMLYTTGELYYPDPQPLINYIDSLKGAGMNIDTILFWVGVGQSALAKLDGEFNYLWKALDNKYGFVIGEPSDPAPQGPTQITDLFFSLFSDNGVDIIGTVLGVRDNPIVKQRVVLYRDYGREINKPVGEATTDEKGQFYFYPRKLKPGMYTWKVKVGGLPLHVIKTGKTFVRKLA